tara:strand:+ start:1643 stop:2848 length:1206 start_codon:yes stop_codon:yes gene_type:complete
MTTITWLFDRRNKHGFLPNLIKDETLVPGSSEWWDLCITKPYAYEFRFLRYCMLDKVPQRAALVSDIWEGPAYYPINLNYYDTSIDYFSYMDIASLTMLKQGRLKVLFYYSEGDDPLLGVLDSLVTMCKAHNVDLDNVKFTTANGLIGDEHPFVYFPDDELYYRYLHAFNSNFVKQVNLESRDKLFTCLNRMDKVWRKVFCSTMHSLNLFDDSYFSYTGSTYDMPSEDTETIEEWLTLDDDLKSNIAAFDLQAPYYCDDLSDADRNNHKLINTDFYTNAYWNIVVETHFKQQTIFLTEKTFKPILNMQPFILVGNPYSIKMLKQLGYKTFGDFISEDYDEIVNPTDRMRELLTVFYSIASRSDKDQKNMIELMKEILEYNQSHFLKPKTQRIKNYLNKLEY